MDDADRADHFIESALQQALSKRLPVVLSQNGACHFCTGPVQTGLFCDDYCRWDYERLERAKSRTGK